MSFRNQPIAGTYLVRPAIQSPNYASGSTGWSINRDGSSEFNSGTFRGSIKVGPVNGQNFIVNNSATGDVIDVYDASGNLVFSIDAVGEMRSLSDINTRVVLIGNGVLTFLDSAQAPQTPPEQLGTITPDQTKVTLSGGTPHNAVGGLAPSFISVITGDSLTSPWIEVSQRGISGALVQTDGAVNQNQMIHMGSYSGSTNASGHIVVSHGAAFTPTGGIVTGTTPHGVTGATFGNLTWGLNTLTSTQADVNWTTANTGAAFANSGITFDMLLWG